jgi:hypothetical protein
MKRLMMKVMVGLSLLAVPAVSFAQPVVSINIGWAAPPPVVEVSPGVQVVQDYGEEVFFTGGHYWVERGGAWYWTNDFRGHWVPAGPPPVFLRDHHRGSYLHYRQVVRREKVREERHEAHRAERREEHHEERR